MILDWFRGISKKDELIPLRYNADWLNLAKFWNDHNSGVKTWDNAVVSKLTSTGTTSLIGTTTNDNAAAGNVGEIITTGTIGATSLSNGVLTDIGSVTLTAGDWMLYGQIFFHNTTNVNTQAVGAVTTTSGNSFTGAVQGVTRMDTTPSTLTGDDYGLNITQRASLSGSTTYYLKAFLNFSVGTGQAGGTLFGIRTR